MISQNLATINGGRSKVKIKIKLNTVNDAGLFVAKCGEYPVEVDFVCGRYTVDAKSLMGVLGVGLGRECEVEIHSCYEEYLKRFEEDMELWKVEE